VKLADGTFLVGDPGTGTRRLTYRERSRVVVASLAEAQVPETVTRGSWVEKPDLSRWTKSVGPAHAGFRHGVGGFVAVSKFEVWGTPVPRRSSSD
jgi:hypothetical protein